MQEKQNDVHSKTKIHISIPIEIERLCREESKKREITFSDVFVKAVEERDYLEKKLIEKDRIIENSTEIIHKNIVESLEQIKKTNFELNIVSSSLSSIPKVTEEARNINERCTKSAEIIRNFNIYVNDVNKSIAETKNNINEYNKSISSNKNSVDSLNKEVDTIKLKLAEFLKELREGLSGQKERMLMGFTNDLRAGIKDIINEERENISVFKLIHHKTLRNILIPTFIVTIIMSILCIYFVYTTTSANSDKITVFNHFKQSLCSKENATIDVNYKEICK